RANLEKTSLRLETARSEERLRATESINALLREENQRKDAFIASLAHELRNPVAIIAGVVQVAAVQGLLPDAVEILRQHVTRLVAVLDTFLDRSLEEA